MSLVYIFSFFCKHGMILHPKSVILFYIHKILTPSPTMSEVKRKALNKTMAATRSQILYFKNATKLTPTSQLSGSTAEPHENVLDSQGHAQHY